MRQNATTYVPAGEATGSSTPCRRQRDRYIAAALGLLPLISGPEPEANDELASLGTPRSLQLEMSRRPRRWPGVCGCHQASRR